MKVNGTLNDLDLQQDHNSGYPDHSHLSLSIHPILMQNKKRRTQELAFLPPGKREEGRAAIGALSAAVRPPVKKN